MQLLSYFLIVANTRAFTQGNYLWTIVTDTIFAASNFVLFKKMIAAEGLLNLVAYTAGGTVGSVLAIAVTKYLYGA